MRLCLLFLPLCFIGCAPHNSWSYMAIWNGDLRYDMAKLSYPSSSKSCGILLELIRQSTEIEGYLSVHTWMIPSHKNNPKKAKITFKAGDKLFFFIVDRLEGGERLHLSKEALAQLLTLLKQNLNVTIETGEYVQTFQAKLFEKNYERLCKRPFNYLPEKLVTFELY